MNKRASYKNARINMVWADKQWTVITTVSGKARARRFETELDAELCFADMLTKLREAAAKNGGHVQCSTFKTLENGQLEVI